MGGQIGRQKSGGGDFGRDGQNQRLTWINQSSQAAVWRRTAKNGDRRAACKLRRRPDGGDEGDAADGGDEAEAA